MKVAIIESDENIGKSICVRLEKDAEFLVTLYSNDSKNIIHKINIDLPDIVVLDLGLPQLSANEILSEIVRFSSVPVIVSSFPTQKGKINVIQSFEMGAVDFISKPVSYFPYFMDEFIDLLILKIKICSQLNMKTFKKVFTDSINYNIPEIKERYEKQVIIIGLDNISLESVRRIIRLLPADFPCIIAVTNLPAGYTKVFSDRLNEISNMRVKEVDDKEEIQPGKVLIAPGGYHTIVSREMDTTILRLVNSEKVHNRRPSIDNLMMSVAEFVGDKAIGVLLSGKGPDGIVGLKSLKMAGADTIVVDPEEAILAERPTKAIEFDSHTHVTKYDNFVELLRNLSIKKTVSNNKNSPHSK